MPYPRQATQSIPTPPPARSASQRLTGLLPDKWSHLASLPEPICGALLTLALANQGCGWPAIEAHAKLTKLAAMSNPEIETAFAQRAQPSQ